MARKVKKGGKTDLTFMLLSNGNSGLSYVCKSRTTCIALSVTNAAKIQARKTLFFSGSWIRCRTSRGDKEQFPRDAVNESSEEASKHFSTTKKKGQKENPFHFMELKKLIPSTSLIYCA